MSTPAIDKAKINKAKTAANSQVKNLDRCFEKGYAQEIEKALKQIEKNPDTIDPKPIGESLVEVSAAMTFLQSQASKLNADNAEELARNAEAAIAERLTAIRKQKEEILQNILDQTKEIETTWRGLKMAYANSLSGESTEAKFYLVSMSKANLLREREMATEVNSPDTRKKHTLIEAVLRDSADRFGGTPFTLVILPFAIESDDINFFRDLGLIGRRWRCPIVANLGPSLLREQSVPVSGTLIAARLKDDKNKNWQKLVAADNPVDAESLTYLVLMVPRVLVRMPYQFQPELEAYKDKPAALYTDCCVWAAASYAFAGKIDQLGSDFGVHLMPAGKSYGTLRLPEPPKTKKDSPYKWISPNPENGPKQFPLESDLYKSDANALWANGVVPVVKWEDTNTLNIYGDATLITDPEKITEGEPLTSLGVRLTHDHILHYCNRYMYKLIGRNVDDALAIEAERELKAFLSRNTGEHAERPLKDYTVAVRVNPDRDDELIADIEIQVRQALRKVTVNLKIRRSGNQVEDASRT